MLGNISVTYKHLRQGSEGMVDKSFRALFSKKIDFTLQYAFNPVKVVKPPELQ
jgi:hypothetical protein